LLNRLVRKRQKYILKVFQVCNILLNRLLIIFFLLRGVWQIFVGETSEMFFIVISDWQFHLFPKKRRYNKIHSDILKRTKKYKAWSHLKHIPTCRYICTLNLHVHGYVPNPTITSFAKRPMRNDYGVSKSVFECK
jgi:hypothetical protein